MTLTKCEQHIQRRGFFYWIEPNNILIMDSYGLSTLSQTINTSRKNSLMDLVRFCSVREDRRYCSFAFVANEASRILDSCGSSDGMVPAFSQMGKISFMLSIILIVLIIMANLTSKGIMVLLGSIISVANALSIIRLLYPF